MRLDRLEDPQTLIRPKREIEGSSAILLPFEDSGKVDWDGFENHVARTLEAGLQPAVNMDTGFAALIDSATRAEVLRRTQAIAAGRPFVAGAFVSDQPGSEFAAHEYQSAVETIQTHGGTPIIFQSYGLARQRDSDLVDAYLSIAEACQQFLFFELGAMFAPFGRIYSLNEYEALMQIPAAIGAKHSSLRRVPEWERLVLRNRVRSEFKVYTGNDLAIDMVMYGSDYLLGLSTFAPDAFRRRDELWAAGDPRFYELNDVLQYLGAFAFRAPTSAYKHSAAMFLKLRGWIACDDTHPNSDVRPESDRETLQRILDDLERQMEETA